MILISHRGNLSGKNEELENSPEYIMNALNYGFNVEGYHDLNKIFHLCTRHQPQH